MSVQSLELRRPALEDGPAVWALVRDSESLDLNSRYFYLMFCTRFSDTSVVATEQGRILGFVAAFVPPRQPDTVFVWQIGVAKEARGKGLARRLLDKLAMLPACTDITALEATVSPSNAASRALFRSFADAQSAELRVTDDAFAAESFADEEHEREDLFRIEPLQKPPGKSEFQNTTGEVR